MSKEIQEIADKLASYPSGNVPEPIWQQELMHLGGRTYELIPLRVRDGKIQVFMTKRPETDPVWPGILHCPGVMLNGPETKEDALTRLKEKEIKGMYITTPELFQTIPDRLTERGAESVFVYLSLIQGGSDSDFYDVENLPESTIPHHVDMIKSAVILLKAKGQRRQLAAFE